MPYAIVSPISGSRFITTSDNIAAVFGWRVEDVERLVRRLLLDLPAAWAEQHISEQVDAFHLDRDAFALLAQSFTGAKALRAKIAFFDAFDRARTVAPLETRLDPLAILNQCVRSLNDLARSLSTGNP